MGIIAAGQITVVDLSDAPVLNTFITASRPTTQTYSKDSRTYKPSYASTPQVLTLKVTKAGSTANIIDSISSLHWFVVDGPIKTEITSKDNRANEYISGTHNEILTTKLDIDLNKGSKRYEVMGIWPDPSTGLDVQFGGYIDLLLTQNGATGPQGPQGDTGNGIANTVITYGLSMSDTTEPATWSSERPALVKGMYLWTRTVIIYTNGSSTTSYQISYIAKDADESAIDKAKQELLEKLETVRDESLEAVDEAKQQLVTVRDESLAAAEEAKQGLTNVASELNTAKQELSDSVTAVNNKVDSAKAEVTQAKQQLTTVADDLSKAKTDFQNAVSAVDTKATNLQSDLTQAKQDLASQAQQLQEQATAQSELTNRVSSVEETANGTKTTVSELSKTVAQNGKDITSVTARTKVVEDDLAGTKTTLSQVQTTANSTSQKTATLETGLNGLSAKFNSLSVGNKNYLPASRVVNRGCNNFSYSNTTKSWTMTAPASSSLFGNGITFNTKGLNILLNGGETLFFGLMIKANKACSFNYDVNNALTDTTSNDNDDTSKRAHSPSNKSIPANVWTKVWFSYTAKANVAITESNSKFGIVNNTEPVTIEIKEVMVAKSNVPVDYQTPDADVEQKIAEYKQNADQNYASLQTTVQNLDGTVQHNKTVADQTAQGFTTRIESLETYKDGETTRANQYFESARTETARQLTAERTAIAKDYVAKSTYTSDVTGIRNELSATTTTANTIKTNLANYQASNDRAVANLQSNIQTANGNISSLKTKVEAVPGQITSAVSAVEGKIPTNVSTRNLILKSNDFANPHKQAGDSKTTVTSTNDYFVVKSTGYTDNAWGGMSWNMSISEVKTGEQFSILMPVYIDSSVTLDNGWGFALKNHKLNVAVCYYDIPTNKKDQWVNVSITFKASNNVVFDTYPFYVYLNKNGLVRIKPPMLVRGNLIPSDYQPAFEDTESDINAVSSQIKQTADGMTLLATKTELNNAKTELQSGITTANNKANAAQNTANNNAQTINTHTTQISALNTGLQAKVSQTDFNTLSGRVTNAENNITAKANELSSKITSVEGKIPTTVGGRNYALKTGDSKSVPTSGGKLYDISSAFDDIAAGEVLIVEFDWSVTAPTSTSMFRINRVITYSDGTPDQWNNVIYKDGVSSDIITSSGSGHYSGTFNNFTYNGKTVSSRYLHLNQSNASGTVTISNLSVRVGSLKSDWEPAPEDTISDITKLNTTLTQTADGLKQLSTKVTSQGNTINTHTTQISALNTGLQAKVSQTDFNTLSGRVTNAENNITAKANELSSKITSVEGKIPTNVSTRNLILRSNDFSNPHKQNGANTEVTSTDGYFVIKSTGYTDNAWGGMSWNMSISEMKAGEEFSILMPVYIDSSVNLDNGCNFNIKNHLSNIMSYNYSIPTNKKDQWFNVAITFKSTQDVKFDTYPFYVYIVKNGLIRIKPPILVRGNLIPSDYQPAFEDTASDITKLSSELTQTKDGITLLATKTELNNAKNELQSGINTATNKANSNAQTISTHTTQISALNTGLQAKVSQSDFNTLSGRVTTAENNITAKANELSSKITSVEGKIPTNVSTRNLILRSNDFSNPHKQNGANTEVTSTNDYFVVKSTGYTDNAWGGISWNMSISEMKAGEQFSILMPVYIDSSVNLDNGLAFNIKNHRLNSAAYDYNIPTNKKDQWFNVAITFKAYKDVVLETYPFYVFITKNGLVRIKPPMLVRGNLIPSDWQPASEDTISDITKLNTTLSQTSDGLKQLSTKVTSQGNTITSHTNSINSLTTGLNAKVSQSEFNTLSGRVTTAENNITAKANELSSKITSVEGKIPKSASQRNLVQGTSDVWSPFVNINTNNNWRYGLATVNYGDKTGIYAGTTINIFVYLSADEIVLDSSINPQFFIQGEIIDKSGTPTWTNWGKYHPFYNKWSTNLVSGNNYRIVKLSAKVSNESYSNTNGFKIEVRINGVRSGKFHHRALMITTGDVFPDSWSPAPEDALNQINAVSSEFKQTTDAIKASVTSLDKSTVKSSSLTINSDGIVMKAGKSTTDVANAIGSYFAVNQNAINLFSDKINVKGNMIVNGTITGDKIKASSVDVSKIVGIDANFIKSKIEHAMIDWLKGKTITAYNDNMTIDLQNGRISFKDGSNAVYRQTPDGIHTGFLHFDAGSLGGIYAAFGATSTREGINSRSSAFAGIRCYRVSKNGASHEAKIDKIEIVGDTVQFGHGYSSDGSIAMGGGFIMDNAAFANETPYSLNRVVKSIESLWRILHDHARNTGYRFNDQAFINALNNEYNAWHELHNM